MIDYIQGPIAEVNPTYVVVEAGGIGYQINIALPTYSQMIALAEQGEKTKLYISEIIREDTHDIYGFSTKAERALFVLLMTVSGVGANTARMILSAFTAAEVRQIIATANTHALSQVKGLGPKTAQRIIVDLKDKVLKIDLGDGANNTVVPEGEIDLGIAPNPVKEEAVSALTMLGFAAAPSGKVVDKILHNNPQASVEDVIKQALKML